MPTQPRKNKFESVKLLLLVKKVEPKIKQEYRFLHISKIIGFMSVNFSCNGKIIYVKGIKNWRYDQLFQ